MALASYIKVLTRHFDFALLFDPTARDPRVAFTAVLVSFIFAPAQTKTLFLPSLSSSLSLRFLQPNLSNLFFPGRRLFKRWKIWTSTVSYQFYSIHPV